MMPKPMPHVVKNIVHAYLRGVMDIFFPRNCLLCRQYHPATGKDPLCPACLLKLPWNKTPLKFTFPVPVHFDQTLSILNYTHSAPFILKQFKFHNKTSLRHTFAGILEKFLQRHTLNFSADAIIIPIPLDQTRRRERGYNQSSLIAQALAKILQRPCREDILHRQRPTAHQSQLHAKERWTNMDGAFRILPLVNIVGREIILVDDIFTTGATASEAAKTLKKAGAFRVTVITLAIVPCESCTTTS